ncbi:ribosomal protein S18-alanine N-acetyltransferase [Thiosocius teredinicola]|uniref:ribosomal protein S18-alanine N-acetyltransferase n=1 Tax=Thiosocius teredinicola TaxID=1973002 RepID=UPI000990EBC4
MSAVLNDPIPLIRPMGAEDLDAVLVVEHNAYTHPWSVGIMRDCLRVGYSCWVCEVGNELVGHAVMSVAIGEAHLLNICVDPQWQGRGVGRRLLRRMFRIARERDADTMFLEVRDTNLGARGLYESEGFGEIGRRRDYYPAIRGREDAIVYAKAIL